MVAAGKAQLRRILEAYALYCSNMRGALVAGQRYIGISFH